MRRLLVDPDRLFAFLTACAEDPAVRLWTVDRLPFHSEQTDLEKEMVRRVSPFVRDIPFSDGKALTGVFVSDGTSGMQPDAENIVYYNFREGRCFTLGSGLISFERSYREAPNLPGELLVRTPQYHHIWQARDAKEGLVCWALRDDQDFANWTEVPCPLVEGSDSGRHVWAALRRHHQRCSVSQEHFRPDAPFSIHVSVEVPRGSVVSASEAVKGCVDGAITSFQLFAASELDRAMKAAGRLAALTSWRTTVTEDELLEWMTRDDGLQLFGQRPFTAHRIPQLFAADEYCVAGSVAVNETDVEMPTLTGSLSLVDPKSNPESLVAPPETIPDVPEWLV